MNCKFKRKVENRLYNDFKRRLDKKESLEKTKLQEIEIDLKQKSKKKSLNIVMKLEQIQDERKSKINRKTR